MGRCKALHVNLVKLNRTSAHVTSARIQRIGRLIVSDDALIAIDVIHYMSINLSSPYFSPFIPPSSDDRTYLIIDEPQDWTGLHPSNSGLTKDGPTRLCTYIHITYTGIENFNIQY